MFAPGIEAAMERNRAVWEAWTRAGASSAFDDLEAFRAGHPTLSDAELEAIGPVDGRRLLHLQCHIGLSTLSLARAGGRVTGVDFSAEAIALARRLAEETSLAARFVNCDLYRLPARLHERFEVVYTGRGALCWLPDVQTWAHVVAHLLEPGGHLVLFDSHPTAQMFDEERPIADPRVRYPYVGDPEGDSIEADGTFRSEGDDGPALEARQWSHSIGSVVSSLVEAGMEIDVLQEHDFSFWRAFPDLRPDPSDPRLWRPPDGSYGIPLTFTLRARRG